MSSANLLLIVAIVVCMDNSYAFYPVFYPSYRQNIYTRPSYYTAPYGSKRGPPLDRISMGFIKRSDEMPEEIPQSDEEALTDLLALLENERTAIDFDGMDKRGFDSISGLIRKKRSVDQTSDHVTDDIDKTDNKNDLEKDATSKDDIKISKKNNDRISSRFVKKNFDRLANGFVKKDSDDLGIVQSDFIEKRPFDSLNYGFVKKNEADFPAQEKRYFDRLSNGFVKKEEPFENEKRRFDRLQSGFIKKNEYNDDDKRGFDRLSSAFIKKRDDIGNEKRRFDRLSSGFVKKGIDRLSSGFVKKDGNGDDKRGFDRVSMGFVKKNDDIVDEIDSLDKRRFDRLSSGFVKKEDVNLMRNEKRRFDRLSMGFVKKSEKGVKYGTDDSHEDFMDETNNQVVGEKPQLDTIADGLVQNTDENKGNKHAFDTLSSGFVKRPFDRLSYGFVKRPDVDEDMYLDGTIDKRYFDRLSSGFVKRDSDDNSERLSGYPMIHRKRRSPWYTGGRLDRIGYGFIKRDDDFGDQDSEKYDFDMYYPFDILSKRRLFSRLNGLIK